MTRGRCLLGLVAAWGCCAYALKRHYAGASAAELDWILAPTAGLVGFVTGHPFVAEAGVGYVNVELSTAIVPGCAGVNFLLIASATLLAGWLPRQRRVRDLIACAAAAAPLAIAATLLANTLRITIDIGLRCLSFGLEHGLQHRLLGVVVYFLATLALHRLAQRGRSPSSFLIPALSYLGVALGIPFLNGAAQHPGFWPHALAGTLVVGTLLMPAIARKV